ncbi:MAG TPA: DUF4349 domain-containing protein [Pyrinomonadaceae bacterium]|nr:DUF4349 domain-containing protein [Pyrinomonadaceae bacterium]
MRSLSFLLLLAVTFSGCYRQADLAESRAYTAPDTKMSQEQKATAQPVSLLAADSAETVAAAADRKIIKNAELTLEVTSPTDGQRSVASIAESLGGFVVTSETKLLENRDPSKRTVEVKLIVRVPANQFDTAVASIEKLSTNVINRAISGSDVTEEFIDLEARSRTQKALELQFLEIMKQANTINGALEVQRQIADVRTEIEKLEGRKRFLENRSSLSTITVDLKSPVLIAVNTSSFGRSLRESVSDSVGIASVIVLGLTRFFIVSIPIVVLIILPLGLIASVFIRRVRRMRLAQRLEVAPVSE